MLNDLKSGRLCNLGSKVTQVVNFESTWCKVFSETTGPFPGTECDRVPSAAVLAQIIAEASRHMPKFDIIETGISFMEKVPMDVQLTIVLERRSRQHLNAFVKHGGVTKATATIFFNPSS